MVGVAGFPPGPRAAPTPARVAKPLTTQLLLASIYDILLLIFYDFKKLSYDLYSEFCVELDIKTLKDVVLNLSELFNSVEKKNGLLKKNRTTYEDECKALKEAMKNPKGVPVCKEKRIIPLQNQPE